MNPLPRFGAVLVIGVLVALTAEVFVSMVHAASLSPGTTASGETVSQSGNCPGGGQQDEHCLPGGPGSPPARPGGQIHPPVPPVTPPVAPPITLPITPPSGRPPTTRPQDPELPLYVIGSATATFHIHDADRDIIYTSDEVPLTFMRRIEQDMDGNTQYILAPVQTINTVLNARGEAEDPRKLQVIWMAEGREFDCTVKGKAVVTLPTAPGGTMYLDPTEHPTESPTGNLIGNITEPAYGYLNVVGPDGGDFHSVVIKAFNPDARLTKTCPGNPPLVTKEKFEAGFLLHILSQPNTREDGRVIFQGHQEYDQGNPLDFLNLLPPGAAIPESARRALQASRSGTSLRYTWTWKLLPGLPPAQ